MDENLQRDHGGAEFNNSAPMDGSEPPQNQEALLDIGAPSTMTIAQIDAWRYLVHMCIYGPSAPQ